MESQTQQILAHLRKGATLTPIEALNMFGCFRLSGRIFEIKDMLSPNEILHSEMILSDTGKRVAKYWIEVINKAA